MARNWYGQKRISKDDLYTRKTKTTNADIRWEIYKIVLWVVLFILYTYFVIMGKSI